MFFFFLFFLQWMPSLCSHSESASSFPQPVQIKAALLGSCCFCSGSSPSKAASVLGLSYSHNSSPASSQLNFCTPLSGLCEASCKSCGFNYESPHYALKGLSWRLWWLVSWCSPLATAGTLLQNILAPSAHSGVVVHVEILNVFCTPSTI